MKLVPDFGVKGKIAYSRTPGELPSLASVKASPVADLTTTSALSIVYKLSPVVTVYPGV